MPGLVRDGQGRITGFFLYERDSDLLDLSTEDRLQWPELDALATGRPLGEIIADHPILGPLQSLMSRWDDEPGKQALIKYLPRDLATLGPISTWNALSVALASVMDEEALPKSDREQLEQLRWRVRHLCGE